jgi:hypothetical protein
LMLQKVSRIDLYSLILFATEIKRFPSKVAGELLDFDAVNDNCKVRFLCSDFLVSYSRFHLQHAERITDVDTEDTGKDRQTDRQTRI